MLRIPREALQLQKLRAGLEGAVLAVQVSPGGQRILVQVGWTRGAREVAALGDRLEGGSACEAWSRDEGSTVKTCPKSWTEGRKEVVVQTVFSSPLLDLEEWREQM